MVGVHPRDLLGRFNSYYREVHYDWLLVIPDQNAHQRRLATRIDFLMRHVRGHEDEIPRPSLCEIFQALSPTHPRLAAHDKNHALQLAVMVGACFGVGIN
jgi:hypothetical protein